MKKPTKKLPEDATIRSINGQLGRPEEYVRQVLENMRGCSGECQVRIGIVSNSNYPDYEISMLHYEGDDVAGIQCLAVVGGKANREIPPGDDLHNQAWSSAASSFADIQQLLGELRGLNKPQK
ncbi:hypothetical protein [Neorhizobium galegae]|uniref:Uncharacterized protein n=1 Tax=Neorhizobium galegae bv. orientalis str. HAMBI 540 TaxID=1028800 RepID=A0A068T0R1_NEOGA|nr:hypothetical protein [Neorhizobium galegae]MCQ1855757.1 hypothetical protein [Neorhizobium galegae]CDN51679.1 Hypothetical protein RG540_PA10030 [Neorhizobium galegae bv. orientalis str. HAMBI 540]CDZ54951.1 Hypothetical protein NGAL_HAMBI2427_59000 [Neorhizobium galegae bv. orientalis]